MTRFCLMVLMVFGVSSAQAYIPKLNTILTRTTANNGGTNALIIKRTLQFKEENLQCEETWHIVTADLMKVDVTGTGSDGQKWSFEILYKDGQRYTSTEAGGVKGYPLSPEFYEPLLHYRNPRALMSKLIQMQMLPSWAGSPSQAENFIQLDRLKGALVYAIGASESKNTQSPPQIWMEQDSFVFKKLRLGTQVEVEFDNVKELAEGKVKIPETQNISWKSVNISIQNSSVQMVSAAKITPLLKIQRGESAKLPEEPLLKEFYTRLR